MPIQKKALPEFIRFSDVPSLAFAVVALGRNQPLKREKPKWKSDYPMTDGQLRSKRDEFWDTAPAFEGRKEIWDALKAAAQAFESNDHELAQAIIDGASITLPHGKWSITYNCKLHFTSYLYHSAFPCHLLLEGWETFFDMLYFNFL